MKAPLQVEEHNRMAGLIAELTVLERGVVTVGFHADQKNERLDGETNAEVAAAHEFGTKHIPRRPFLAPALDEGKEVLGAAQQQLVGQVLDGTMTAEAALAHLGELGVILVQEKIRSNIQPPLKPETIAEKGSSRTLIDDGEMLRAVTYEVDVSGGSRG